jgi:hypothetical protein
LCCLYACLFVYSLIAPAALAHGSEVEKKIRKKRCFFRVKKVEAVEAWLELTLTRPLL